MEPHYVSDTATLYRGDALAVLQSLPSASVDALITDPPYSSGGMVRGDRATTNVHAKYVQSDSVSGHALEAFTGDSRDQRAYAYWCALWLGECLRVCKTGAIGALFTDWRQLPATTDALQAGGFVWRGLVPWWKPSARPQSGRFSAQCEYVVWGSSGAMPVDYCKPALPGFYQASPPREREHITEKPLSVMRQLVKIVPEGGTVLDPFAGSGTTGVAAILEHRKFIGIEITEHYADVAAARLQIAETGRDPRNQQGVLL